MTHYQPCQCNTAKVSETDEGNPIYGPCGHETARTYAPGHDAKLKGLLIRLYLADQPYYVHDGGMLIESDPATEAEKLGWSHFLTSAKTRAANRPPKRTRTQAIPAKIQVKIGRWTYAATILERGDDLIRVAYKAKDGSVKQASVRPSAILAD